MPPIIPQIIGLLAVATFLLSYQQKNRHGIILLNVTSRALYILQYLLLGAYSGAVLDVIGAVSSVLASKKNTPFMQKHLRLVILGINAVILAAGISISAINRSPLDLLPMVGVLLHTGAFWISNEKIIRRVSLAGSPFWFVYNFASKAYGSAIGDLLTMGSILLAMFKYRKQDTTQTAELSAPTKEEKDV